MERDIKSQCEFKNKQRTKRMRRTLFIYGVCWMVGLGMVFHLWGQPVSADTKNQHYVVQSGDTVWSIASGVSAHRDVRDVTDQIMEDNHLRGNNPIYPGQVLVIPQG